MPRFDDGGRGGVRRRAKLEAEVLLMRIQHLQLAQQDRRIRLLCLMVSSCHTAVMEV